MPSRRVNPNRVKLHRSYSVLELAACLGVHKNTVRHWQAHGMAPIDHSHPILFQGATVRAFLSRRNAARKRPCPAGTLYCLRCREPRGPASGKVGYTPITFESGNLRARCECCDASMYRRVSKVDLAKVMPGRSVLIVQDQSRLNERTDPSLNCEKERQAQ